MLEHTPRNAYEEFPLFVTKRNYGTTVFSIFINRVGVMKPIFVTGIGTDVGKTLVSVVVASALGQGTGSLCRLVSKKARIPNA